MTIKKPSFPLFFKDPDFPLMFKLFLPIYIERTLTSLFVTINSYFIAEEGEVVISAINLSSQVITMLTLLFSCVCSALFVVISQLNGAGLRERAKTAASSTLALAVYGTAVIALIFCLFPAQIMKIFFKEIDSETLANAVKYIRVYALAIPFSAAYDTCGWTCRGYDDHKTFMFIAITANALNPVITFFSVKIFKLGIIGAAIGVVAVNIYGSIICYTVLKKRDRINSIVKCLSIDFKAIKNVLYLGVFNSSNSIISSFSTTLRTGFLVPFGNSHIAASSILGNFTSLFNVPSSVITTLTTNFVAKGIGSNDSVKAQQMFFKCYIYDLTLNSFVWLIGYFLLPYLFPFYTQNPETLKILGILMIINAVCTPLISVFVNNIRSAFNGAGDVKFATIVSIISTLVFSLGLGYVFTVVCNLGIIGATLSIFAAEFATGIIYILRYKSGKWKNHVMV